MYKSLALDNLGKRQVDPRNRNHNPGYKLNERTPNFMECVNYLTIWSVIMVKVRPSFRGSLRTAMDAGVADAIYPRNSTYPPQHIQKIIKLSKIIQD